MMKGLHQPGEFRDNCGFGLIAHMEGQASHDLLKTAIESLTCMTHRGGIAADGRTGDGCGLLFKMPVDFMRARRICKPSSRWPRRRLATFSTPNSPRGA